MPNDNRDHTQREDHPWEIDIPDHAPRKDSPTYAASRALVNKLVSEVKDFFLGTDAPRQDHHGGGLWVMDDEGWFTIKNLAGMEWSQQFCADPKKVDKLRQFAARIYKAFPKSVPTMQKMMGSGGYELQRVLDTPITDSAGVAGWCDSIFNASVPLPARRHTGVLEPTGKANPLPTLEGGVHHYPTPITDIQLFKRDDFQLWVADNEGQLAAVVPSHPPESKQREVTVAYATPGSKLHQELHEAWRKGHELKLPADHPMAKQAFAAQKS